MKLTVNVTQTHIDEGERNSPGLCPIALALDEQHPCGGGWRVSMLGARRRGNYPSLLLPEKASQFVKDFDAGRPVFPFVFDLYDYEDANACEAEGRSGGNRP